MSDDLDKTVTMTAGELYAALNAAGLAGRQQATENAERHWEQVLHGLQHDGIYVVAEFIDTWLCSSRETRALMETWAIARGIE